MDQIGMGTGNDIYQAKEKFKFREPIVLVPIIFLSLLRGITSVVDQTIFFAHGKNEYSSTIQAFQYYNYKNLAILILVVLSVLLIIETSILNTLGVIPGVFLVPFMLEVHGRKPAFILLFSLCLLSSIISYAPYQLPLAITGNFIVAIMKGGVRTITTLAICEYCGPKHRFAYLVADETVRIISANVTNLLYNAGVLSKESSYVSLGMVVLALACIGSVYWWPESPYWLANQGRGEEGRAALLWLRAEGDAARAELRTLETPQPPHQRSTWKPFWLSLLVAILYLTVAKCSSCAEAILITIYKDNDTVKSQPSHTIITYCGNLTISFLLVLISYRMKRKVVYLCATVVALVLVFILSIWICKEQINNHAFAFYVTALICNILIECGPFSLSFALLIEAIPQKYYTYISCICTLCFYLSHLYFPILSLQYRYSFPLHISLFLFTVPVLVVVMLIYWLAPETRNKNLSQIDKHHFYRYCKETPEQIQDIE